MGRAPQSPDTGPDPFADRERGHRPVRPVAVPHRGDVPGDQPQDRGDPYRGRLPGAAASPYQSILVRSTGALERLFARSLRHVRTALAEDASPVAQATGAAAGGLLAENPALADYYRDSPEAALDLLRLIREATKEDRYRSARAALARREGKDDTRHDLCPPTGSDAPCSGSARRPSPS